MMTLLQPGTLIYASEDVFEALLAQARCTPHVRQDLVGDTKMWTITMIDMP